MSGGVAAHAAFNGSGTQGLAVTNKVDTEEGDVMSVFWNANDTTRQLLHGSSIVEVPSSGAQTLAFGGSRLFTINSDIDCLGDLYLELGATFPTYTRDHNKVSSLDLRYRPHILQSLIERVEVIVGTQVWQTIESEDLRVLNATELTPDVFEESGIQTSVSPSITPDPAANPQVAGSGKGRAWIVIPSLTKTLGPALNRFTGHSIDGYPMAAAPHQSFKIRVHFREAFSEELTSMPLPTVTGGAGGSGMVEFSTNERYIYGVGDASHGNTVVANLQNGAVLFTNRTGAAITRCNLYAKQIIMCNEEREHMRGMPFGLPKRLKMSQNANTTQVTGRVVTVDLDHFSLFASHLLITGFCGFSNLTGKYVRLASAELKLNASSYSGVLPGHLLESATADSIGIFSNKLVQCGGDHTPLSVEDYGIGTYVFPLASTAYSGSSVPLNRFDSIRLRLVLSDAPNTHDSASYFINVTCCGETTSLFKGGTVSLAMY